MDAGKSFSDSDHLTPLLRNKNLENLELKKSKEL